VKPKAIVLVVLVFATSGWLAFTTWPPRTGLAALGLGLVVFLVRLPEREAPPADRRLPSGTDPRPAS